MTRLEPESHDTSHAPQPSLKHMNTVPSLTAFHSGCTPGIASSGDVLGGREAAVDPANDSSTHTGANAEIAWASASKLFSLAGSTIVVTGGGRGLGQSLAVSILRAGASVACIDLLPEPNDENHSWTETCRIARSKGLQASYHVCDTTIEIQMEKTFKSISETAPSPVRGVVACAGVQQMISAVDYPIEAFRKVMEINVLGSFVAAKVAARLWINQNIRGSLVFIASMSGQIANRSLHCTAYNSSKAAIHQMCRSLAQEWGQGYGIRVNTLSPGYIRTAMTAQLLAEKPEVEAIWMQGALLGRLATPEDFHGPIIFLLSAASAHMTGADLRIDGGHCASA